MTATAGWQGPMGGSGTTGEIEKAHVDLDGLGVPRTQGQLVLSLSARIGWLVAHRYQAGVDDLRLDCDRHRGALARVVDAMWREFGSDLIDSDDEFDQAYRAACAVIGVATDRRTPQQIEDERAAY